MSTTIPARLSASLVALAAAAAPAVAQEYAEAWRAAGFEGPESVVYDPGSNSLFVSNMNIDDPAAGPMEQDGNGYISQIDLEGRVISQHWLDGLNAPKGIDVLSGRLFAADVGELVEVDIATGEVVSRYPAPDSGLLNDVAADGQGRVWVSDTFGNAVWLLENGTFSQWLRSEELAGINGLYVEGDTLMAALLGDVSQGFENITPSNVKRIDIATRAIGDFGSAEPVGVLDGIEPAGDGSSFLVTDNPAGTLIRVSSTGETEVLAATDPGAADHEVVQDTGLVVIPITPGNTVVAFRRNQ
jgi:hypothetical protein